MNLARALKTIHRDHAITALGVLHGADPTYAYLYATDGHVQVRTPGLAVPLLAPFTIDAYDDSQRTLVARLAWEVEWTLFRGGEPLEEEDVAPKKRRRR